MSHINIRSEALNNTQLRLLLIHAAIGFDRSSNGENLRCIRFFRLCSQATTHPTLIDTAIGVYSHISISYEQLSKTQLHPLIIQATIRFDRSSSRGKLGRIRPLLLANPRLLGIHDTIGFDRSDGIMLNQRLLVCLPWVLPVAVALHNQALLGGSIRQLSRSASQRIERITATDLMISSINTHARSQ